MRRVAVTGLGVISPLGNDVQTFWDNIKAGKNGISGITKFDCTDYRVKVAAEVHDFEPKDYMEKLRARITELLDGAAEIPEDRILTEAAVFADKCAIDEEITRLNSHLLQLKSILTGTESTVGKKLDFLVQEMNREANTIGSKANDITITNHMLNIKSEIEKIREQVQNIE